jgi:hypothetical protein
MKPAAWAKARDGTLLMQALDDQMPLVMAKYYRLGVTTDHLMMGARLVMNEQILNHGKTGKLPKVDVEYRKAVDANGLLAGYARELDGVAHRMCITWLTGNVETSDGTVVTADCVDHVFRRWRQKAGSLMLADPQAFLARFLRRVKAKIPRCWAR